MITLTPTKDIVLEKMCLNQIRLMSSCITNFASLLTEGLSNFYNFCVRTTTWKEKTLLESNLESKDKLTLLMLPQDNLEVFSKLCVDKLFMFLFSFLISSLKSLKFLLKKTKRHLCVQLFLRISVKWSPFSQTQPFLIKKALKNNNLQLFKRFISRAFK